MGAVCPAVEEAKIVPSLYACAIWHSAAADMLPPSLLQTCAHCLYFKLAKSCAAGYHQGDHRLCQVLVY